MALTERESAALRELSARLRREDPALASALSGAPAGRTTLRPLVVGLLAVEVVLVVLAVWLENSTAVVLAVTLALVGPPVIWVGRRLDVL